MTAAVLFLQGHFRKSPGKKIGLENGIIAEPGLSFFFGPYGTVTDTGERVFPVLPDQGNNGPEPCPAVRFTLQPAQQQTDIFYR